MKKKIHSIISLLFVLLLALIIDCNNADKPLLYSPAPAPQPLHGTTQGSLQPQECGPRCTVRCSKTAFKKPCMFFCQKCCSTCLCVPSGTYGNKQACPCYNNWKT